MAQNITLLGASYSDVPSVQLPKTGGGTALFVDSSDADATASDIASGKTAYVNGNKVTGTASGGGGITIDDIATNTAPSGAITLGSSVTSVGSRAFANKPITSVVGQNTTSIDSYAFSECKNLTSASFPSCTQIGTRTFEGCTNLESIYFPELTRMSSSYIFINCSKLFIGVFPKLKSINQSFRMSSFKTIDLGKSFTIGNNNFNNSGNLKTLILRDTTLYALTATGTFASTPFASSGSGGTLYVPQALISTYQSATNWSTILGYANNSIVAIEGSPYENAYADGTPIT